MDEQRQDDLLEPTYSSFVPIRDAVLKTGLKQWTIGRGDERERERESGIARHYKDEYKIVR